MSKPHKKRVEWRGLSDIANHVGSVNFLNAYFSIHPQIALNGYACFDPARWDFNLIFLGAVGMHVAR